MVPKPYAAPAPQQGGRLELGLVAVDQHGDGAKRSKRLFFEIIMSEGE